jgi:hypothetical protein
VTGMMGAAAACCDDVEDEADHRGKLPRGKALGRFRSAVSPTLTFLSLEVCADDEYTA